MCTAHSWIGGGDDGHSVGFVCWINLSEAYIDRKLVNTKRSLISRLDSILELEEDHLL